MKSKYTKEYAWDVLMRENRPTYKQYDSGVEGIFPECRNCRFHRPYWKYETCVYEFCPYSKKEVSTKRSEVLN